MNKPLEVGITGGIGSGKSLVCKIFETLGIPIYDADSRAKILMTTDRILISQIKKEFGDLSYHSDGSLNKEHLREAFKSKIELEKLNTLVHPRVATDYKRWVEESGGTTYLIKEAALLIESGSAKDLGHLVVVSAPSELRIERVLSRDQQRTRSEIENIMKNQMEEEEKIALADDVIYNDGSRLVISQVLDLHERLSARR